MGPGSQKKTIRVEYKWRPTRCGSCKIFGHTYDQCPKNVVVLSKTVEVSNDGFYVIVNKQNNGKTGYAQGAPKAKQTIGSNFEYQPKGTTSTSKGNEASNPKNTSDFTNITSWSKNVPPKVVYNASNSGKDSLASSSKIGLILSINMTYYLVNLTMYLKRLHELIWPLKQTMRIKI